MDVQIAHERAFVLHPAVSDDQAKERAWSQKLNVFGTLNALMFRPKDDEVRITRHELRYEPFWFVEAKSVLEYDVRETFTLRPGNPSTSTIALDALPDRPLEPSASGFTLTGTSRCRDVQQRQQYLDGMTGDERPAYAQFRSRAMSELTSLENFAPEGAVVVPPTVRASYVVRQQLMALMRAVHADRVHTDTIEITDITLVFRPLYIFEYHWAAKQRTQSMELDAVTGDLRNTTRQVGWVQASRLDREMLFDVGAEAAGMLVPGGGIALKVGRMVVQRGLEK